MKTILLLVCGLFLISQVSFGKETNKKTLSIENVNRSFKSNGITFKNAVISKTSIDEKHRIWLNLTNTGGAFKQILVGYITGATNGWDKKYDSPTIDSNPYIDFYSINLDKNLSIQGRGLPFVVTDEVPLGYKTNIAGTFQISIDEVDGLFLNQDIFLKDNITGTIHNLKNGGYSFTTATGRFNDRFVMVYVDNTSVSSVTPEDPIVAEVTDPIVLVPEVPAPIVTEPVTSDPIVTVPEVPAPDVTEPEVTDPIVSVPEVPAPIVTEPVTSDPIVTVPEVPAPIVTDPIVSVPEVPAPIVTEPVTSDPIITVPEVPAPVVTEPVTSDPIVSVPAPIVTEPETSDPIITVPEVPAPVVTEPVTSDPIVSVPAPIVTEPETSDPIVSVPAPIITEPEAIDPIVTYGNTNKGKGKSILVAVSNGQINIYSGEDSISEVFVFNMGQMQLFERRNINANEFVISNLNATKQVLIIKTQLKNGKWIANKIVL